MKKQLLVLTILILGLSACSTQDSNAIKVYTRDGASGAREAFSSIIKLEQMSMDAAETTTNGDMAKQVGSTVNGIGYVSLSTDLKANHLKALKYHGVAPSVASVHDGSYGLARPFSYVTRASGDFDSLRKEALVAAFIDYMSLSTEGLEVILSEGGIVDLDAGLPWAEVALKHPVVNEYNGDITLKTGGSTSVVQTLDALMASFMPMAGGFQYEPNHTGSSDGFKRTLGQEKDSVNRLDIGFASRTFKPEETVQVGMAYGVYCLDAVVVVVNEKNMAIEDADATLLNAIFSGEQKTW